MWRNWGRTVECYPAQQLTAASTEEVQTIVRESRNRRMRLKVVGAGHSFSALADAPGTQLSLDPCAGIVAVDADRKQVTVKAGTRLHALAPLLAELGLAMENLGDIDRQSVAGALATGTHGTGIGFRGLATQVVALTLVDGQGDVHHVDGPDVAAHVISLGALGIVTEVTLQCVDRFVLEATERPQPLDNVLDSFLERCHEHDHFEFFWFPHTATALTKAQRRLAAGSDLAPLSKARRWLDDDLLANRIYGATCALAARVPAVTPAINRLADKLTGDRTMTDWSTNVYTTRRDVRFREMEYGVPVEQLPTVVRELRDLIERKRWQISFPIECRAAAADDLWLSTATGRATGYVAVHRYWRDRGQDEFFRAAEEIFRAHGGRPHWGKLHTIGAAEFAELYPRFGDFVALRDRLDPDRVFGNEFLAHALGA